ncbi:hypothetical protein [Nesterenkonia sp. Act20]|uniref:hypothetical protein n=1 Tax=Nesterenkonia sp. Act20 TaxID=1483432 RepID=UPI001C43DA87|nr:hypothetical protein [Nesterenkonia sp. Act20]
MDVLFGSLLLIAGAALLLWSALVAGAATPDRRRPLLFGSYVRGSRKAYGLQVLGSLVSICSMYFWIQAVGTFGAFVPFVAFLPHLLAGVLHNGRVHREQRRQDIPA